MDKVCCQPFNLGHYCLLIVDYYSKFIAVENLQNTPFETVINKCKNVFSQFGIPKQLIMSNGPKVTNFVHFQKLWKCYIISPHYHQSNSLARSIQTVKRSLSKAEILKIIFLQCYP